MKNILIVLVVLLISVITWQGITIFKQQNDKDIIVQKDKELAEIKNSLMTANTTEQELRNKLIESENARNQLQSQVALMQNKLAEIKEQLNALPKLEEIVKENPGKDKSSFAKENMKRYAKAILKAFAGRENRKEMENDKTLQATFIEFMAEMAKLMAKHNLDFDMWGRGSDELYKAYAVPEIRQWFCDFGASLFEELGVPLTEAQLKAVDEAMKMSSEYGKKLDDPALSRLERSIMYKAFQSEQSQEFAKILTEEQSAKLPAEIASTMTGGNSRDAYIGTNIDRNSKTREECSNIIIQKWEKELKLNETEKQSIKYVSDMYVNDYITLRNSTETEYGKEFMDFYIQRYDRENKDLQRTWWTSQQTYFKNAENKNKRQTADLRFAELQLKYQKQIQNTLPDKGEQVKQQSPVINHFPYLEY